MPKILVIDDEEFIGDCIKDYIGKRGYEVVVALTGQEGLNAYVKEKPDLVILDLGLPDINGLVVLKEIKEKMPALKVMVMTAYKETSVRNQVVDLKADYLMLKPVPVPKLYEELQGIFKQQGS
jgi:DNA-binding response OmpR family regulator